MAMLLTTIGVPPAGVALIMGVDRILDMSRTAINVTGDVVAASLMDKWVGGEKPVEEVRAEEEAVRAKADDVIEFLEIGHVADELGRSGDARATRQRRRES